ncbi:hypothetical protein KV557_24955 [Kitasatospora aureofaciens]|uniref:hypothetical protein n=1 Tax=Kitasatospora aureofaciens TaxID=1894 RepID=UPI001C4918C0|nr:hypothetical protein [Kitasatospora aureofaciens]MBV6700316.1 hypothetical protein [Kitasatospora aureofaciens]
MTHATSRLPLPAISTVRALATFLPAHLEVAAQDLLQRIPAEQHGTPDAVELLRIPRTLGQVAEAAAHQLENDLLADQPDETAIRLLWKILLDTARPFHDHPQLPQGVREALRLLEEGDSRG